ncbi:endonuclease VII domain-containing protein [Streptomyces polyrhachis]|uniref:Endonuclease VII domain-containing protein n=1 Tax=Streptomyces polyrhachis TaxID=1282885 RepID=A0ABW2GAZ1_9ACTN
MNYARPDGLQAACRVTIQQAAHLKSKYGITVAEREGLIAAQGGVCVICPSARPEHVDHDHGTGRVRGVLCFGCDAALGQFKDRPDAIGRAAAYVEGNPWKPTLAAPGVYRLPS